MAKTPGISDAEWHIMRVLWKKSPLTVNQIIEKLSARTSWKPETIRTLINRLTKKKALAFEKKGRRYYFYPLVSQQQCLKPEIDSFFARAGTAVLKPILAAFIKKERLSDQDIQELQQILNKKGRVR